MRTKLSTAAFGILILLVGVVCLRTPRTTSARDRAAHPEWPLSVNAAVTKILAEMNAADKALVKAKKKNELIQYHFGWGMGIRNSFGLWGGNYSLLSDCHVSHPDEASMVIMEAVWQKLHTQ